MRTVDPQRTVVLKVTSAFAHEGVLQTKGAVLEVDEELGLELLRRGKAELAEPAPVKPQATKAEQTPPEADTPKDEPFDLEKANRSTLLIKALELGLEISDGDTKAQLKAKIAEASKAKG